MPTVARVRSSSASRSGTTGRGDGVQVVDGGAGLVGGLGAHDPQLVGLPQQVDELGEPALERGAGRRRGRRGSSSVATVSAILRSRSMTERRRGLGGVGGEDGAVLEPGDDLLEQVAVEAAVLERCTDAADRGGERALLDGRHLLPAVQLLGDVDELEVGGERPGEHDGRRRVDSRERRAELVVLGLAGEATDALDEGEQLGALVAGQRLAEQLAELAHRGAQGCVLARRRDPGGEGGDVGLAAVGLEHLLGRGPVLGGHGDSRTGRRFRRRYPSHHRDTAAGW